MNRTGLLRLILMLASTLVLACGCASPLAIFDQDQWRIEEVVQVLPMSGLDDSVNQRCLQKEAPSNTQMVAVVAIRVHRAPHQIALAIPSSVTVKEKDRVRVNFDTCELRLAHAVQPAA